MKNQNTDTAYLTPILLVLLIFISAGWYFAEADNEILRKELSQQTGEEVRK